MDKMQQKIISVEELEKLYYSMTNEELCKRLGITKKTLIGYLKRYNISLKGKGNPAKLIITSN